MRCIEKYSIVLEILVVVSIHSAWQTPIHEFMIVINICKPIALN